MNAPWKTVLLALLICPVLTGCNAFKVSDVALCSLTAGPRAELLAGLIAHPETPAAVDLPAQNLLIEMAVCPK